MSRLVFTLFALLCCALPAAPASAADLVLEPGNHIVEGRINGVPVRLRVDPETAGYIILNGAAAQRIGLRRSMIGARTTIGPVSISGSTKVARVAIGGVEGRRRLIWTDREAAAGADGLIGPADMPFDRVVFRLRQPAAGERTLELPMEFERSAGLFYRSAEGEQPILYQISTIRPDSIATGAAGALLAARYSGTWSGEPGEQMIKYGVVRPVRPLALGQPPAIANVAIPRLVVRTSDNRGNATLPTDASADPDEIVVTGNVGRQRARYHVSLGLDWLSGCSSIAWDNRTRRMTLSCV